MMKSRKNASALVSVIAFFTIFFVFAAFAIDFSLVLAARAKLQNAIETTALTSVGHISEDNVETEARKVFSFFKVNQIQYAQITEITAKKSAKAILIKATSPAPTYFLSALGINTVEIQAQASAQIIPIELIPDSTFTVENQLQFKAPFIITPKEGAEIKVVEGADTAEYKLFIGLNDKTDNTRWVDITCTSNDVNSKEQYFDFDIECAENYKDGISAAEYIRIVNNNASITPDLFKIEEVSLINTAKLIKRSSFDKL